MAISFRLLSRPPIPEAGGVIALGLHVQRPAVLPPADEKFVLRNTVDLPRGSSLHRIYEPATPRAMGQDVSAIRRYEVRRRVRSAFRVSFFITY
jgi:hypothetical protein